MTQFFFNDENEQFTQFTIYQGQREFPGFPGNPKSLGNCRPYILLIEQICNEHYFEKKID